MKKIKYFLLMLLFLLGINVNASETVYERTIDNNYGVNKKWNINESNLDNVLKTEYVDSSLKIYDYAEILTEEEEIELRQKAKEYIEETKMDVVILTINQEYHNDYDNEEIAADFYDYNDFGIDFDKYSGTLLLRNTYDMDPYFDIYTFGEAQRYYEYDRLQVILDDIYPDLHNHNYLNGFSLFINHLNNYYKSGVSSKMKNTYIDDMGYIQTIFCPSYVLYGVIGLIVSLIVICIFISKNKMVKKDEFADVYLDKSSVSMDVRSDVLVNSHVTSYVVSHDSSSGGYGGGSHSGSSGGGHSSGGGRHG